MGPTGAAPPAGPPDALDREVLAALPGPLPAPPVPAAYRAGLAVVAAAMVLLPAAYVGLVGLTAHAVYAHAVSHLDWLAGSGPGGVRIRFLLYLAPLLVGGVLLLFLIKPLFARRPRARESRALEPRHQPLLFAFVERLCRSVGAPPPARIQVDCSVNAAAGHLGLVTRRGGGLVLTIGLPLAAGLTLRQLAGVLAHEFGHFTQGMGMRLSQLIRRVNAWFARVVYERDAWDERLIAWSQVDGVTRVLVAVARFFVWLTRRVLWLLMLAGHALSCFLMRQMELDADGYEARLAGSQTFAETALQLRVLSVAGEAAYASLADSWREGRLTDDLPGLIAGQARALTPEAVAAIREAVERDRTGLLDTHPADRDRVARVQAAGHPAAFPLEEPASVLFRDFQGLCRAATLDEYRDLLGDRVDGHDLVSPAVLLGRSREDEAAEQALARVTQGLVRAGRPLFLGVDVVPAPGQTAPLAGVSAARAAFEERLPVARLAQPSFARAEELGRGAALAERLLAAGLRPDSARFQLPAGTPRGIQRARDQAARLELASRAPLADYHHTLAARILSALAALRAPEVARVVDAAAERSVHAEACVAALWGLERAHPTLVGLRESFLALTVMLAHAPGQEGNPGLVEQLQALFASAHARLTALRDALSGTAYPFDHAAGLVSVGTYAVPELPPAADAGAVYDAARGCLDNLLTLYHRVLGRLALTTEAVESAAGLARLPPPTPSRRGGRHHSRPNGVDAPRP